MWYILMYATCRRYSAAVASIFVILLYEWVGTLFPLVEFCI